MSILSLAFYVFLCINSAYLALGESKLNEYNLQNDIGLELKPMFLKNHGGQQSEGNLELKEFYDTYHTICGNSVVKYKSLLKTVKNYLERYVNLFLINSGTFDEYASDSNEMITIDLEITISREDLAYLQDFSKSSEESSLLKDLSRLDAILSKVSRKSERSYLALALRFSISLLYNLCLLLYNLVVLSNSFNFTPFLSVLLVTYLIYRFTPRKPLYIYVSIIINGMIFCDSLTLYRKRIKDIEIERESLLFQKSKCDASTGGWFDSVVNYFSGDRCLEYYKTLNRNPLDDVSLLRCIIDTYSYYTIETAFRVLGTSIRDFTGEISALWPKPVRWIITLPLVSYIIIIVVFLILILCGKRLKLSFFGASVEIGDTAKITETRVINKPGPRLIATYRPLRMLTRSRFFKLSESYFTKRKKPDLNCSKSENVVEHETKNDDADVTQLPPANESESTNNRTEYF